MERYLDDLANLGDGYLLLLAFDFRDFSDEFSHIHIFPP